MKPENSGLMFCIEDTCGDCDNFSQGFGTQNLLRRMEMIYWKQYRFDFKSEKMQMAAGLSG